MNLSIEQIRAEQQERKKHFTCCKCNKNIADLRFKGSNNAMGFFVRSLQTWFYYCPEHREEVTKMVENMLNG